jgi:rRNA maturation endonuclease Nob1
LKLIVCEGCEAEFRIKHDLDEHFYSVKFCVFCGHELIDELEDELEDVEEWDE